MLKSLIPKNLDSGKLLKGYNANKIEYRNVSCPDCGVKPGIKCQGSYFFEIRHPSRMWKSMYLQNQAKLNRQRDVITDLLQEKKVNVRDNAIAESVREAFSHLTREEILAIAKESFTDADVQ